MSDESTPRRVGRPRTHPLPEDPDGKIKVSMDLAASGVQWLDDYAAARGNGTTRADLFREALREYRERHRERALRALTDTVRPAPKPSSPPRKTAGRAASGSRPIK